tara:strand:+ start:174 stop:431 length:258 start_codon:yes stop_codon:yes gene_type:complete
MKRLAKLIELFRKPPVHWFDKFDTHLVLTEGERLWLISLTEEEFLALIDKHLGVLSLVVNKKIYLKDVVTYLLKAQHIRNIRRII